MRRNYFSIKSIEQLADEVNIDAAYLSRIFRRFHKDTPYRFLVRLKMGHAASLLLNSGKLVKNVALDSSMRKIISFKTVNPSLLSLLRESPRAGSSQVRLLNHEGIDSFRSTDRIFFLIGMYFPLMF